MASTTPVAKAAALRAAAAAGTIWLPVKGSSMGRTIHSGDEVLIDPAGTPRLGEVWAFCDAQGEILVHRYLTRKAGMFRFQGDTNDAVDRPVPPERLIGRVVRILRDGEEFDQTSPRTRLIGKVLAIRGLARAALRSFRR